MTKFRYGKRKDETAAERTLRLYATELHEWNHRYWEQQNKQYLNLKQQLQDEVRNNLSRYPICILQKIVQLS